MCFIGIRASVSSGWHSFTKSIRHCFPISCIYRTDVELATVPKNQNSKINESNKEIPSLKELLSGKKIKTKRGLHREFIFDPNLCVGYKFTNRDLKSKHMLLNNISLELRLNDIYRSPRFYDGKYSDLSSIEIIDILDDRDNDSRLIKGLKFKLPNNYVELDDDEIIPRSAINELENLGYFPIDIKPQNFIKFKNTNGGYDYIPIDAKLIGKQHSGSYRSNFVKTQKKMNPYLHNSKHLEK